MRVIHVIYVKNENQMGFYIRVNDSELDYSTKYIQISVNFDHVSWGFLSVIFWPNRYKNTPVQLIKLLIEKNYICTKVACLFYQTSLL